MDWKYSYISAITSTMKILNLNYTLDEVKNIADSLESYENYYDLYTKNNILNYINETCNTNLNIEFIDKLIEEQGKCYECFSKEKIDTLEYLSKKYELIVLSNWFTEVQINRLKGAGIYKYFSLVYGGDKHKLKPSLEAFDIIENYSECIMVGDSLKEDIFPALKLGIQAILISKENINDDTRYKKISKLEELKEML